MQLSPQEESALKDSLEFKALSQTPGWLQLKRWLEVKRDQAFPKLTDFPKVEEFTYAAMASSALKQSIAEILEYVEIQQQQSESLIKKQKTEKDEFRAVTGG